MRKITSEAVRAFESGQNYRNGNTAVISDNQGAFCEASLQLHGNEIATITNGRLEITSAGWFTSTTKERLNAITGVHIQQKAGVWYLNGKKWSGEWVTVDQNTGAWIDPRA